MGTTVQRIIKGVKRRIYRFFYNFKVTLRMPYNDPHKKVFYLGVTEHSNMGDMAQYYCIRKWISDNFDDYRCYEYRASTVVDQRFGFIDKFVELISDEDIIVFQSGYTTQDMGGIHDLMHKIVCAKCPDSKIVMMPQTIKFVNPDRQKSSSEEYSKAKKMVFFARDQVSYETAKNMFPDLHIGLLPDIVTSLIGEKYFTNKRNGILFCIRNDVEKYYSDDEISTAIEKISTTYQIDKMDTTINDSFLKIQKDLREYIDEMLEKFSKYRVVITDRYHGTIFSLVANTPVIVLKTNDHKVISGVNWFRDVYDDYIYTVDTLDELKILIPEIIEKKYNYRLTGKMKKKYYDNLLEKLVEVWNNN
jgi:exopolysaccharide biosynthesis predicted pyruvyltransferase EpsI